MSHTPMDPDAFDQVGENNLALNELFRIAAKQLPLEELLGRSLDTIMSLSWLSVLPKGGIFLTSKDKSGKPVLKLAVERNLDARITSLCAEVQFGQCLCGRAAESAKPLHSSCIDDRHEISYDGIEPHGHYNVPIMEADRVLGVLVLYLPDNSECNHEHLEFLSHCTAVLALAIDLREKERQLVTKNRELAFQKDTLDEHAIVSITDVRGNITYANRKFCEISGYSLEELLGQNHRIVKSGEHSPEFYRELWSTIASGKVWHGEIKNLKKGGGHYWVNATIVPFLNESGKPFQYVAVRTDITKKKNIEEALKQAQKVAKIGSWSLDLQKDKLHWSDEIFNIFGIDPDKFEASFAGFLETIHPDDLHYVQMQYQDSLEGKGPYDIEHRIIRRDSGEVRWVHERCAHQRNSDGEIIRSDGTVQDITERRMAQEEIRRMAMTDQLTGLANRNQFHRRFGESLKLARRENKNLVLMLLDLDRFKPVNDTYGHQVGDDLLQEVASILTRQCRETDLVARLGGDEFAILLVHPATLDMAAIIAQRIIDELTKPLMIDGQRITIGASIGIASYPGNADNEDELVNYADKALYAVKNSGRNTFRFFDRELTDSSSEKQ